MSKSIVTHGIVTITASALVLVATSSDAFADNRCSGFDDQLRKIGKVLEMACSQELPAGEVSKHQGKACEAIASASNSEYARIAKKGRTEINKYAGNSRFKVGPRAFTLDKGASGTITSTTQRMFISDGPAQGDKVTFRLNELDGKMYVKAHVCVLAPGDSRPRWKKTIVFNKSKSEKRNKRQSKSMMVSGTRGKIVYFKISAQKPNALKFKYRFSSKVKKDRPSSSSRKKTMRRPASNRRKSKKVRRGRRR